MFDSLTELLLRQADIIIEHSADITYLGFCAAGTSTTAQPRWNVCKIEKSGTTTTIKWANGQRNTYNLVFDDYLTHIYTFRKF